MSDPTVPLIADLDEQRARRAVARLRASHPRARSMADRLEEAIQARRVSEAAFIEHSRWCNTAGSWSAGIDPARDAARALYGFVPKRLIGGDGHTDDHMRALLDEYRQRLRGD